MREIKFDAIYKPTGEHFVPWNIDFNSNSVVGDFDGQLGNWCYFSLDGKRGDVILRQYTGLKDKNGTKIYEADILEVESYEGSIEIVSVVFEDGCFCHIGYLGDLRSYPLRDFLFNGSKIKVIGNIHENPELLEVKE